jgi:hypothetical protein
MRLGLKALLAGTALLTVAVVVGLRRSDGDDEDSDPDADGPASVEVAD